jgi:hypothetical protein
LRVEGLGLRSYFGLGLGIGTGENVKRDGNGNHLQGGIVY